MPKYVGKIFSIGNESLYEINNDNGVRVLNFATSKILIANNTMFRHRNIHKFNSTSPNGNTHNKIDHILIDRRRQSSVLDVRSFRAADCDTDHYLVVGKFRERLAVNKQTMHIVDMERLSQEIKRGRGVKSSIVLKSQISSKL
jgi:hypothetical protein